MFRRPRFRPIRRGILVDIPPVLRQAHQLLAEGQYPEAATTYEELARGAHSRGLPQEAQLLITAGHCRLQLNQIDLAMSDFRQGFSLLSLLGRQNHLQQTIMRFGLEMTNKGYSLEAKEIISMLSGVFPGSQKNEKSIRQKTSLFLPPICPACGGSLRSDEVEWIDEQSAECCWCGSTVAII